jgi:hypothetical protein
VTASGDPVLGVKLPGPTRQERRRSGHVGLAVRRLIGTKADSPRVAAMGEVDP